MQILHIITAMILIPLLYAQVDNCPSNLELHLDFSNPAAITDRITGTSAGISAVDVLSATDALGNTGEAITYATNAFSVTATIDGSFFNGLSLGSIQDRSFVWWMKLPPTPDGFGYILKIERSGDIHMTYDATRVWLSQASFGGQNFGATIPTDVWILGFLVYNQPSNSYRFGLYDAVNGLQATNVASQGGNEDWGSSFGINLSPDTYTNPLRSVTYDNLMVFSKSLTDAELVDLGDINNYNCFDATVEGCSSDAECGPGGVCSASSPGFCLCASAHVPNTDYSSCSLSTGTACSALTDTTTASVSPVFNPVFSEGQIRLEFETPADINSSYNVIVIESSETGAACYSMLDDANTVTTAEDLKYAISVTDSTECTDNLQISLDWDYFVSNCVLENPSASGDYSTKILFQRIAEKQKSDGSFEKRAEALYSTTMTLQVIVESTLEIQSSSFTIELAPGISLTYFVKEVTYDPATEIVTVKYETEISYPLRLTNVDPLLSASSPGSWPETIPVNNVVSDLVCTNDINTPCTQEISIDFDLSTIIANGDPDSCLDTSSAFEIDVEPRCRSDVNLEPSACTLQAAPATLDTRTAGLTGDVAVSVCTNLVQSSVSGASLAVTSTGPYTDADTIELALSWTSQPATGFAYDPATSAWNTLVISDGTNEYDITGDITVTQNFDESYLFELVVNVDTLQNNNIDLEQAMTIEGSYTVVFTVPQAKRSLTQSARTERLTFSVDSKAFTFRDTESVDNSSIVTALSLLIVALVFIQ